MFFAHKLIFIGLGLLLTAFVAVPSAATAQAPASSTAEERIHPGDLIEVDELGGFDHDWRGRLDQDGFLEGFTRVADPIFALCKTPKELSEIVREAYSRTLRDPKVIVRIIDRSRRPVAIFDGAVRQPLRLQIRRPVRLSELVVLSGGFTDRASGEITLLRPPNQSCSASNDSTSVISVRTSDILSGKEDANLSVFSGDLVTVKLVDPVYVIGGVNRPGRTDWRVGTTVTRAVASAGGVSDRGVTGRVSIFRRNREDGGILEVDLDRVVSGKDADVEIFPFDIIDVPLKGSARRTSPPTVEQAEPVRSNQPLPLRIIE